MPSIRTPQPQITSAIVMALGVLEYGKDLIGRHGLEWVVQILRVPVRVHSRDY